MDLKKQSILKAVAVVFVIVTAFIVSRSISYMRDPITPVLQAALPAWPEQQPEESPFSIESHENSKRIFNSLGRVTAAKWSEEDRLWLNENLKSPRITPEENADWEGIMVQNMSLTMVAHHLLYGSPVPKDTMEAFKDAVDQSVFHESPEVRVYGISAIFDSGMVEDPSYLAIVEDLRNNDPSEVVRDQCDRFLLTRQGILTGTPVLFDGCHSCD